jgi:uncharacterized LabA/DUF88 family protein
LNLICDLAFTNNIIISFKPRFPIFLKFFGKISLDELEENDVEYDVKQKGVDMKIGLNIAAMAYKRLVDRIILISGDSDFVPAAKVARRQGIDVILDPMWIQILS